MEKPKRIKFAYKSPGLINLHNANLVVGNCFADGNSDSGLCQNGYDAGGNCIGGSEPVTGYCDNGVTGNCGGGATAGCISGSGG